MVVAFGGNAILRDGERGTAAEQSANLGRACKYLVPLVRDGHRLILIHGNGPQVGNLLIQQEEAAEYAPMQPLDIAVGMTQGQIGTMLIPNSVAILENCPHPEAARKLVDFILSERVAALLAASKSAQIPLRESVTGPSAPQILKVGEFRQMRWDPAATAENLEPMSRQFAERYGR